MNEHLNIEFSGPLERLRTIVRACGSMLIAYSGGVDSALLAYVAHDVLGSRMLACIGLSTSLPARELRAALALAEQLALPCRTLDTREQSDERYLANQPTRCFFCRSELFTRLRRLADEEGWASIADGVHVDDVRDHQGGMAAARQVGVRSPLLEAGLDKAGVRALARHLGVPAWDKPAMACLASRVPHGTAITPALLRQVEAAEEVLFGLGFRQFRVRHHGTVARVEVAPDELPQALELREQLVRGIRNSGYEFVTLDLEGYRREPSEELSNELQLVTLQVHRPTHA
jgi:uncharacterized protein